MSNNNNNEEALFLQQNAADTLMRNYSTRQVLKNMGFPDSRALKAIVATGDSGVQVACDWIFAHVNDPHLTEPSTREYILYACPTGPLGLALEEFWQQSMLVSGRNGVHNTFPHITLCGFFKCEDNNVASLVKAVSRSCERVNNEEIIKKFELDYFSTDNYVGLFLQNEAAKILWKLSTIFAEEALSKANSVVEPHNNKQLHITLAYKFMPDQLKKLESLANKIDVNKETKWEVRLYSRDSRFNGCETLRVLYPLEVSRDNQLQLINGDYVLMRPDQNAEEARLADGWFSGTSWMTGTSGKFPISHTEIAVDTDTWTLHKKTFLTNDCSELNNRPKLTRKYSRGADEFHQSLHLFKEEVSMASVSEETSERKPQDTIVSLLESNDASRRPRSKLPAQWTEAPEATEDEDANKTNDFEQESFEEDVYAKVSKPRGVRCVISKVPAASNRRIYIFRHAERVDVTFSKEWLLHSFDKKGNYFRHNINMPVRLPKRKGYPNTFHRDSPITEMGSHQAYLSGQAMKLCGVNIQHVYSSPSLRSVQTAHSILTGLGIEKSTEINLELFIFEWMKWCIGGLPTFVDVETLRDFGINASTTYTSKAKPEDLPPKEKCGQYFQRSYEWISNMLNSTAGDVLIVGHAATLDVMTRQIQGFDPRPMPEFVSFVTKVPYCASVVLEEVRPRYYRLTKPPYPSLTHSPNPMFDWKKLLRS